MTNMNIKKLFVAIGAFGLFILFLMAVDSHSVLQGNTVAVCLSLPFVAVAIARVYNFLVYGRFVVEE